MGYPMGFGLLVITPNPSLGRSNRPKTHFGLGWVGLGWVGSGLEWVVPKSIYNSIGTALRYIRRVNPLSRRDNSIIRY